MIDNIPLASGFMALMSDRTDPRRELTLGLMILLGVLLVIPAFGFEGGSTGELVKAAFLTIMGYWFGKKEEQIKALP